MAEPTKAWEQNLVNTRAPRIPVRPNALTGKEVRVKCYVYSGIPGSGKSTLVRERHPGVVVCSADDFFVVEGEYRFDPRSLPAAHGACLRKFVNALEVGHEVVADNTATTVAEVAPYAALALAYGYDLLVVTVHCDPEVAAARNTHGVPAVACRAMADRLAKRELPPWWPTENIG
jgi:predicted kinase